MKIQRLRVEQLRQFRQPLEITDFSPHINLFHGPNESGKSTLVQAIRAAFFEKHRSSVVSDLQPWGDSSAAPQIEVDFTHQDMTWRLTKRFLQRKRCDLTVGTQTLSGDDAEARLAALLGFQLPSKGASKAEHWGIPGLLWIEQGQGQAVQDAVQNASDHLKSALGASLGEIASSSGDDLIADVEAQRGKLLTRTGRPTGDYAATQQRVGELEPALTQLNEQVAHYQQQVDRLGSLRADHAREDTERPWLALREKQQAAQQLFAQVSQLTEQQEADRQALKAGHENLRLLTEQLATQQHRVAQLQQRQQAKTDADQALSDMASQRTRLQTQLSKAQKDYAAARARERTAQQQRHRQSLERELEQITARVNSLGDRLTQARQVQASLSELERDQARAQVDTTALQTLKRLDADWHALQIQQKSIATRVAFDLEPGQRLQLNDDELTGSGERQLLSQAEVHIAGVGRLSIIPGGEDLGDLARKLDAVQEQHQALLANLQVASLADAEHRAQRFQRLTADLEHQRQLLASHAPQGVDTLQAEWHQQQARQQTVQDEIAALPPVSEPAPAADAGQPLADVEQALRQAEAADHALQTQLAKAEQQAHSAAAEFQRLEADLADPVQRQRQQESEQRVLELRAQVRDLDARIEARQASIDAAQPDLLQQDIQRYGASADQLEASFREREKTLAALQAELSALGAHGLEEQQASVKAELAAETRRLEQLQRRADALSLLLDLLREKRHELTRQLQAPLQKHLNRYVQLLFPEARLEVDDNLMPGQLIRTGTQGPEAGDFNELSFGAREQIKLISRLAYADLLQEAGQPTLLILDDALVHSDDQRLEHMKRILYDAGQRHQILLFTCHPERWQDLGATARDLRGLKQTADAFAV